MQSIVINMSVCLSATRPIFIYLLCMLPVAMARSSSLRYDNYFRFCGWHHILIAWGQWAKIKHDVYFDKVRQMVTPVWNRKTSAWLSSSECRNGGKVCYLRLPRCISKQRWPDIAQKACTLYLGVPAISQISTECVKYLENQLFKFIIENQKVKATN